MKSKALSDCCWLFAGSLNTGGYGILFDGGSNLEPIESCTSRKWVNDNLPYDDERLWIERQQRRIAQLTNNNTEESR